MSLPTFGLDRDLGPVGCRQRPLPHLVATLGSLREPQVVGDQSQAECLAALQIREQVDDVGLAIFVEIAGWFVGEQQRRRIDQRARDNDTSLLAAGHAARIGVGAVLQADAREQIVGPRARRPWVHGAAEQRRNGDIVDRGEVRQQARKLEDEANMAGAEGGSLRLGKRPDIGAVEQHLACGRRGERAEHGHQRRFARAGAADDRDELAAPQLEAGVAHRIVT